MFAIGLPGGAVTAELIAAEEVVRRKSRRDGFSSDIAIRTGEVYHCAVLSRLSRKPPNRLIIWEKNGSPVSLGQPLSIDAAALEVAGDYVGTHTP